MDGDWIAFEEGDGWQKFDSEIGGRTDGGVFNGRVECSCARLVTNLMLDLNKIEPMENALYVSEEGMVVGEE
jgi:hypothetical protein